jgi:hypothetical protein
VRNEPRLEVWAKLDRANVVGPERSHGGQTQQKKKEKKKKAAKVKHNHDNQVELQATTNKPRHWSPEYDG